MRITKKISRNHETDETYDDNDEDIENDEEEDENTGKEMEIDNMGEYIEKLQEEFKEIQREGEEILQVRRSTRDRKEVERLTYTQQHAECEAQHNLNYVGTNKQEVTYDTAEAQFVAIVMEKLEQFAQQYNLQKGLKKFKKKGEAGIIKELRQMDNRRCYRPILVSKLTRQERAQVALAFLTEKERRNNQRQNGI